MKTKALTIIVLVVAVLTVSGCKNSYPEYNFNSKIGDEHVEYKEVASKIPMANPYQVLTVVRVDGKIVTYKKMIGDWVLTSITIETSKETLVYNYDAAGKEILKEGKKQFDAYLEKILELKKPKALKLILK